jgi:hypothetical protein
MTPTCEHEHVNLDEIFNGILFTMWQKYFTNIFATTLKYSLTWKNLLSHDICTYIHIFVIKQGFSNLVMAMDTNGDVGGDGCLFLV